MFPFKNVRPHGTVFHWHDGFRVVALAQWSTKRIGGKTRWVKFSLWCPVCGFKLTREGKRLQLATLEKLMG